jgi:ATF/CREB family transcription factor
VPRASSDPVSRGGGFESDSLSAAHGLLDQEPNPFEQSFSGPGHPPKQVINSIGSGGGEISNNTRGGLRQTRSISPNYAASGGVALTSLNGLPAPINRPSDRLNQRLSGEFPMPTPNRSHLSANYTWGELNSLRSGPLSPSLLTGPMQQQPSSLYDPSAGLRGNLSGLGNSAFPPPSPATAALFAMMTNNTPGMHHIDNAAAMAGGGPRPNEGANEGNQFDTSFGRASVNSGSRMLSSQPQHNNQQLQPYQPQHQHPQQQHHHQPQQHMFENGPGGSRLDRYQHQQPQQPQQQQQQHPGHQPHELRMGRNAAKGGGQNPLYLLSQAQDINMDDAVVAANALSTLGGPVGYNSAETSPSLHPMGGPNLNGSNGTLPIGAGDGIGLDMGGSMSSVEGTVGQAVGGAGAGSSLPMSNGRGSDSKTRGGNGVATNKRKKAGGASTSKKDATPPVAKKAKKGKGKEEEFEDFDMEDDASMSPVAHDPNETEEQKRKNFLERNRQGTFF